MVSNNCTSVRLKFELIQFIFIKAAIHSCWHASQGILLQINQDFLRFFLYSKIKLDFLREEISLFYSKISIYFYFYVQIF